MIFLICAAIMIVAGVVFGIFGSGKENCTFVVQKFFQPKFNHGRNFQTLVCFLRQKFSLQKRMNQRNLKKNKKIMYKNFACVEKNKILRFFVEKSLATDKLQQKLRTFHDLNIRLQPVGVLKGLEGPGSPSKAVKNRKKVDFLQK